MLLIKVEFFFCLYILHWATESEKYIIFIDIILWPKLCQFVQFEISPSISHKVFIFLKITHVKFHQPGTSSLFTLDLNANVNNGRRLHQRTGDDISSLPVLLLCTGELKKGCTRLASTKAGRHDIAEILLKVALNTKNLN